LEYENQRLKKMYLDVKFRAEFCAEVITKKS
jgi:hypothetical protein